MYSPRSIRNNSKYVSLIYLATFDGLSSLKLKRFKIEAYCLRWNAVPENSFLKVYDTGRWPPRGVPNAKCVAFWGYFVRAFPFSRTPIPYHSLPTFFPYRFLSHDFTLPLPFPKEVNKKLSYRRQNALSVVKHTNAITTANIYCLYTYANLDT